MPAKPIAVPGMKPFGLAMNLLRSSKVQVPPFCFIAAEKLKPFLPSPFFSLTVFQRLGPTRLGPPFSKVWQAAHFLAAAAPFSTEAVWSSFSIGSEGAAAAAPPLSPASSFTAISKPGFSGVLGENNAWAVKLVTSRMRQVPSTAPRILLSSKESISGQAPHRKKEQRPSGRQDEPRENQTFLIVSPSFAIEISVCPGSGNPYKRPGFEPVPPI